jgi:glycosyltransferase involved in cell wall biosynthesis
MDTGNTCQQHDVNVSRTPGLVAPPRAEPRTGSRLVASAIVPVRDNEATLAAVLTVLLAADCIDEIVCVDFGSTDRSLRILRAFDDRITVSELDGLGPRGRGAALAAGVWRANGSAVVFVDAASRNLREQHVRDLLEPLEQGAARTVLGFCPGDSIPDGSAAEPAGARFLRERANLRADLMPHLLWLPPWEASAHAYLDRAFRPESVAMVPLRGLRRLAAVGEPGLRPSAATQPAPARTTVAHEEHQ